jgi:hypothetical protein
MDTTQSLSPDTAVQIDPLPWLLELDTDNPGVRFFALTDLLNRPENDPEVRQARRQIMQTGPVPVILGQQAAEGYWVKAGGGYSPKYQGTSWSLLILAELGADPADERVQRAGNYVLDHSLAASGAFAYNQKPVPSGAVHCLNGNMVFALTRLGFGSDPRLQAPIDWLARAILGQAPIKFYQSGTSGPGFACAVNMGQPCAWGANKAIRALIELPASERTPLIERALAAGAEFLLSRDPLVADYPFTEQVSSAWFKLGFPLSYWSDVLETLSNLVALGFGGDPRLNRAITWLLEKQDEQGRWKMQNHLNRKMWIDIEGGGRPSKWITLRALRMLKQTEIHRPASSQEEQG